MSAVISTGTSAGKDLLHYWKEVFFLSNKTIFNGIIEKATIKQFRKFHNIEIPCGRKLTVIVGQNGTQKTTLLGLLAHPFSMSKRKSNDTKNTSSNDISLEDFLTITGHKFESKFAEKFKLDKEKEAAGEHEYSLYMLDKTIGESGVFTLQSIKRDNTTGSLRFWQKNARNAGDGYMHFPVIYLSLKRVTPIGEESKIKSTSIELTPEEFSFLQENYMSILNLFPSNYEANKLSSPNKKILIAHPNHYSALTISAGQDNLGSILTAILSFKRLKEAFPTEYKGGLLFIDEIESTLYPAAQENLIKRLFRYASDYNIQIFITTHSQFIIDTSLKKEYSSDCRVIYLKSLDEKKIEVDSTLTSEQIHAHLTLTPYVPNQSILPKIRVYSEDKEARLFFSALLPTKYKKLLSIIDVNIGANELIGLRNKKIEEFTNNLLLLDGDQPSPKSKNILILPGNYGPDKLLFNFLSDLPESSAFWPDNQYTGCYNKQTCFRSYPFKTEFDHEGEARKYYKNWMQEQLKNAYWDKNGLKAFKFWKQEHLEEVQQFVSSFVKSYNFLAKKKGIPTIT